MDTSWEPKVSVVIPVYNGANYMREAIDSALAQTYSNIEVIVVNDGSSDGGETDSIARSYGDRIVYIKKENGGVSSALNEGIRHMTGEYFSWLSHDDIYSREKIQHQIEALSKTTDKKTVCLCGHCFINENSECLSKKATARFGDGVYGWRDVVFEIVTNGAFFGCALLIPKAAFDECGTFHEGLRFSQDALMWLQIFLSGYSLAYNADVDVYSRIHGKQVTQTGRALFQKDSLTIGEMLIPDLVRISSKKENYLYLFAKRNAKYGNKDVVKSCIYAGNSNGVLNFAQKTFVKVILLYGNVRPVLRRAYYRVLLKSKNIRNK